MRVVMKRDTATELSDGVRVLQLKIRDEHSEQMLQPVSEGFVDCLLCVGAFHCRTTPFCFSSACSEATTCGPG